MNPFDINKPCIKVAKSELVFGQYITDLKRDKYSIEVQDDDAIKRNQICFDFMKQTLSCLDGLYMNEICLLIDTIKNII